jgi:hypothetical protein
LAAQQKLNESAAVMTPRFATVNPAANAALVEGMKGFFNPTGTINNQFRTGMMGTGVLGYDEVAMSQSIAVHTTGAFPVAPIVSVTAVNGATTISMSFTSGTNRTLNVGDVFTVANVFAVNPQTRQSTGALQQFVVTTAASTASGTAFDVPAVVVYPPIYGPTSTGDPTALQTVNRLPTAGDVITFVGTASTGYPQNLVYHRDAITFATADLMMPQGVDMASRQTHNGISMRIVRQYDINNDRMPCRVDVLYGAAVIRPPMGVRIWG